MRSQRIAAGLLLVAAASAACRGQAKDLPAHASGYVEATDVRVSSTIAGRVATVLVQEGARVEAGTVIATLGTTDIDLALARVRAERAQAVAQLSLLKAGPRPEDVRQAEAQAAAASADRHAADSDLSAAKIDEARFQQLVDRNAGSAKQRDDAVARRQLAEARLHAADERLDVAKKTVDRVKAGARPAEIAGAKARIAFVDAQAAIVAQDRAETTITAPTAGIIASRLVEPGELVGVGTPLVLIVDLDHAWANVYLEETLVPQVRLDQPATVITDAGDRLEGRVTFISPKAEFTPRNVQTANERAKLVYRLKVTVDNRKGILKPGMPVEVDLGLAAR
ncbi:MAG TPA: HlyD family efflux transporter periplasmic adaptor subunit [Vicinamibacterales bacterium]|nr:HlyD family efflux transporter periplasmic adaptor subunit [Vicinamibacterales bacterium]